MVLPLHTFTDELLKIAEDPVIHRLPSDPERATNLLRKSIQESSLRVLGYPTVIVEDTDAEKLESIGFHRTRLAVPLPGKKVFEPSWRMGHLHAHKLDGGMLVHADLIDPTGLRRAARHAVQEGLPAFAQRFFRRAKEVAKNVEAA